MRIQRRFVVACLITTNHFASHAQEGSLDPTLDPGVGPNQTIRAVAIRPDGRILVGGWFYEVNGSICNRIICLNTDGSLYAGFNSGTGPTDPVECIALQADGKVLIGGSFTTDDGIDENGIARLNSNGTLDAAFNAGTGASAAVHAIGLEPGGKILIGGMFTFFDGTPRNRIARLNMDGSHDASFDPGTGANGTIDEVVVQMDGKILIAGSFTLFNGTARNRIARLDPDGSLDMTFDPGSGASASVFALAAQSDGRVLIGGSFTSYNGIAMNRLARLNPDGGVDGTFNIGSGANGDVYNLRPLGDGKILMTGLFTNYAGTARLRVARLNANGNLDADFNTGTGTNGSVFTTAVQADGKVLIAGEFTGYNGTPRTRIARIIGTSRARIRLHLEGPYNGTTMTDALRNLPSFPLTEPFTAMGYAETGYVSGATIGSSVVTTTGNNAIVDWVIVEMRPASTPGTVAASRAVLLQRDGDVVDLDGVGAVGFAGLAAGNYCVAVKPRNHLPVMLSATTPMSYGAAIATVDFTLPTTQVYDNDARKNTGGVMVLAAGDVTFNETVSYTGAGNDRDPILTRVGSTTPNNSVSGYWREDVNMDGVVKYTGSGNDRDIILTNVGSTTPNNTRVATLP